MVETQAGTAVTNVISSCIDECLECRVVCLETASDVLSTGRGSPTSLVSHLWDCADVCETNASLMLRNSALIGRTCETCAEICESCAAECGRFLDDPRIQTCAVACRRCAATCRETADLHRNRTPLM
jgi:hypothetical protein